MLFFVVGDGKRVSCAWNPNDRDCIRLDCWRIDGDLW